MRIFAASENKNRENLLTEEVEIKMVP